MIKLAWGKAHLTQAAFSRKHGDEQAWRWALNHRADQLAGEASAQAFDWQGYARLQQADKLCTAISYFLGHRAKTILVESAKAHLNQSWWPQFHLVSITISAPSVKHALPN